MLTLHGTLDALLPIATDADVYDRKVTAAGAGALHRYYVIEEGNHVDGRYDAHPNELRLIHPCWEEAFSTMEGWAERGAAPPPSQFVPDPHSGDVANQCTLARSADVIAPSGGTARSPLSSRARPRAISLRVHRLSRHRYRGTGRLTLPKSLTRKQACGSGTIRVRVSRRGHTLRTRRVHLRRDCTHRATAATSRRGTLTVRARFFGNRAIRGASSRARHVRGR